MLAACKWIVLGRRLQAHNFVGHAPTLSEGVETDAAFLLHEAVSESASVKDFWCVIHALALSSMRLYSLAEGE